LLAIANSERLVNLRELDVDVEDLGFDTVEALAARRWRRAWKSCRSTSGRCNTCPAMESSSSPEQFHDGVKRFAELFGDDLLEGLQVAFVSASRSSVIDWSE